MGRLPSDICGASVPKLHCSAWDARACRPERLRPPGLHPSSFFLLPALPLPLSLSLTVSESLFAYRFVRCSIVESGRWRSCHRAIDTNYFSKVLSQLAQTRTFLSPCSL